MHNRVKVMIRCRNCGEKFILRAKQDRGKIDTGFKRCVCDNDHDLDIETMD